MSRNVKRGRPRVAAAVKRISNSITLTPATWKWVHQAADQHGVGRSQIFDDALKVYKGELEEMLKHLREELASQEQNVKNLTALSKQHEEELTRLRASQQMVGSILSPHGGPSSELSKEAKEKARTLRAVMVNPNNIFELHQLVQGKLPSPQTPILGQAYRSWGSWTAVMDAVVAAERAKDAVPG